MPGTDIREECDGNALPPCFLADEVIEWVRVGSTGES